MTKNSIYLLVFAFVFTCVSCNKDNNNNESSSDLTVNTLSAKWDILDSNSPYASFEFNKDGNYIVVENDSADLRSLSTNSKSTLFKNNTVRAASTRSSDSNLSPIHFGTYQIEGNNIILSGFGLIEVISITAEEFVFSFTLEETGDQHGFVAGKSDEPISSSDRTNMLCRTWIIEHCTIGGENFEEGIVGSIVLFSKAGTYLVLYEGAGGVAGLSEWKWANQEETKLYYSWANWTDNWSNNVVTITDLTTTNLVIQEGYITWYLKLKP